MNLALLYKFFFEGASPGSSDPLDTFVDTASTLITSHTPTPSGGYSWVQSGSLSANTAVITAGNRLRTTGTGEVIYYADVSPGSADYSTQAILYAADVTGASGFRGVGVRQVAGSKKLYTGIYNFGASRWELYWIDGVSFTLLGSYSQALSTGTSYHVKLTVAGSDLDLIIDGVSRVTATDTQITAEGFRSLYLNGNDGSDSAGLHVDDFGYDYVPPAAGDGYSRSRFANHGAVGASSRGGLVNAGC